MLRRLLSLSAFAALTLKLGGLAFAEREASLVSFPDRCSCPVYAAFLDGTPGKPRVRLT